MEYFQESQEENEKNNNNETNTKSNYFFPLFKTFYDDFYKDNQEILFPSNNYINNNKSLFFINDNNENNKNLQLITDSVIPNNCFYKEMFSKNNEINENNENNFLTSKKRGRKTIQSLYNQNNNKQKKTHSKFFKDNILRKIEVNFLSFLVMFINDKIKKNISRAHPLLKKLDYKIKQNITKNFLKEIKNRKIFEILKINENNENVLESITKYNNIEINNLLNKKYLEIFKEIFAYSLFQKNENKKSIDIKRKFHISKKILLFDELLNKEKKNNNNEKMSDNFIDNDDDLYVDRMKEICLMEFS